MTEEEPIPSRDDYKLLFIIAAIVMMVSLIGNVYQADRYNNLQDIASHIVSQPQPYSKCGSQVSIEEELRKSCENDLRNCVDYKIDLQSALSRAGATVQEMTNPKTFVPKTCSSSSDCPNYVVWCTNGLIWDGSCKPWKICKGTSLDPSCVEVLTMDEFKAFLVGKNKQMEEIWVQTDYWKDRYNACVQEYLEAKPECKSSCYTCWIGGIKHETPCPAPNETCDCCGVKK